MKLSDPSLLKTDAFINGAFVSAPQDKRFAVQNPSTGEIVAEVADFGADGITAAIDAAEAARKDGPPPPPRNVPPFCAAGMIYAWSMQMIWPSF